MKCIDQSNNFKNYDNNVYKAKQAAFRYMLHIWNANMFWVLAKLGAFLLSEYSDTSYFIILYYINKSATLLKSVNKKNELMIWEKIFIHKHAHHNMNFEIPPECSH